MGSLRATAVRLREFFAYALLLAGAGPTVRHRLQIFVVANWFLARSYVPALPRWRPRVTVRGSHGRVAFTVTTYSDLDVMREIFIEKEYDVDLPEEAEVVFDLGSNIGLTILELRQRFPRARIYGFEPDPRAFETLMENTRGDGGVTVMNVAVAGSDGTRTFFTSSESWLSSFQRTRDFQTAVSVSARSLDSLVAELGVEQIDLMKIDIEGGERDVLRPSAAIERIRAIVGELHLEFLDAAPLAFLAERLPDFVVSTCTVVGDRCRFAATRPTPAQPGG